MELTQILSLPWAIQLALASGYAAYAAAYVGIRSHHKTIEIAFASLVFSLITTATYSLLLSRAPPLAAGICAFFLTVIFGGFWRKWGRGFTYHITRALNISWADNAPSAWATLLENTKYPLTQVSVRLIDGTWLRCEDASPFANAPFKGHVFGDTGDIALYLTHEDSVDGVEHEMTGVTDPDWGYRLTYVPASQVKYINMRFKSPH